MATATTDIDELLKQKDILVEELTVLKKRKIPYDKIIREAKDKYWERKTYSKEYSPAQSMKDKICIKIQEIEQKLSKLKSQIREYNKNLDEEERQEEKRLREKSQRDHIKWESFFVEAARGYLSGDEFERISQIATNMMNIRS